MWYWQVTSYNVSEGRIVAAGCFQPTASPIKILPIVGSDIGYTAYPVHFQTQPHRIRPHVLRNRVFHFEQA